MPSQYSTATVKAVSVDHRNGMQWRERSLLQMALKQSLINGFERNEPRYRADAYPEAVWVTTIDAEQHSKLQQ
jgi:hypothetical protein